MLNEVAMLKKTFYISILLGAFALSGCTNDKDDQKKIAAVSSPTEQLIASDNNGNTIKKEVTAPIPLNLTQEQKEEYYQKYVAVIENRNAVSNVDLDLEPITAFLDEHWLEVADFEKLAKERASASIVVLNNQERYHPASVPKTVTLKMGSREANIIFKGSFDTQLNENTSKGRQLFSVFNGISSEAEDDNGSWTQLGYDESLVDSATVYDIAVGGKYSQSGIISSHIIELEFHCNKNGGIS